MRQRIPEKRAGSSVWAARGSAVSAATAAKWIPRRAMPPRTRPAATREVSCGWKADAILGAHDCTNSLRVEIEQAALEGPLLRVQLACVPMTLQAGARLGAYEILALWRGRDGRGRPGA